MRCIARLALALPALAAIAWLAPVTWRLGAANAIVYDTAREMATWSSSGAVLGRRTVARVSGELERAAALASTDPSIEELAGRLAAGRGPQYAGEALAHFRRAVSLRPTSPYAWASIAEALYRKGDTGPIFEAALRRAAQLGPAEPEVQMTVADYGLAVWDEAAPQTRQAVEAMVSGAMKRDPAATLQLAQRRGRLTVACRHLADAPGRVDRRWSQLCGRRETVA
jgi:cytochrome c-type biogenesis protein CcmH/NrfG